MSSSDESSSSFSEEDLSNSSEEESMEESSEDEMLSIPFHELNKIRKIDTSSNRKNNSEEVEEEEVILPTKKRSKSEPPELSAKKPVSRFKVQLPNLRKKKESRDPRFDNLSGEFDSTLYRNSYGFINDIRLKEVETLRKKVKKTKDPEEKERLQKALNILLNQVYQEKKEVSIQKAKSEHRKQQVERLKEGKSISYMKRSDLKKGFVPVNKKNVKKRKRRDNWKTYQTPWKARDNV